MFGDVLTTAECQQILNALARCELPFQCAHGRPTIVPLLRLAAEDEPSVGSAPVSRLRILEGACQVARMP